ncbi:hypothetical protein [Vibrio fluvialis]|uniref:hypothetical protein n=1 Tax=Vibrio fluvialis TaxID=676 RepID=UPI001E6535F9|nr:hypothetical protein [Vibrio fluvialis]
MKSVSLFALLGCALLSTSTMAQEQPSGRPDMGPPPSFSNMDSNGDGVLTQDEVQGPCSEISAAWIPTMMGS